MTIQDRLKNNLVKDASGVWCLKTEKDFGYSDGAKSEKYLKKVFKRASDLSTRSKELETYIHDWASEYHLSMKRAQLFSGFKFDPSLRVLEVGCGCGAITRFLGENFDDVVSVEGSINRARLARLRTKELQNVSIVCAPFQELEFEGKFDLIFCIGVYEYSESFVAEEDPYNAVLEYFNKLLTPEGSVLIAIENQLGIKYFTSSTEDHTGVMFEGVEGYHIETRKVKTFGRNDLQQRLGAYFNNIRFYYPYPDYKLPTCILTEEFLDSGCAGELISQIPSRDYNGNIKSPHIFNETLVNLELSKNTLLPHFSNSFLVLASKSQSHGVQFDQLASIVSSARDPIFSSHTRIYKEPDGSILVNKAPVSGGKSISKNKLLLVETTTDWQNSYSLHTLVYQNSFSNRKTLDEIFHPCKKWINHLKECSHHSESGLMLPGSHIDSIWSNFYISGEQVQIIDKEWIWEDEIRLEVLVIRSIFVFLTKSEYTHTKSHSLQPGCLTKRISQISTTIGVNLDPKDFSDFVELESEFQSLVYGGNKRALKFKYILMLNHKTLHRLYVKLKRTGIFKKLISKLALKNFKM